MGPCRSGPGHCRPGTTLVPSGGGSPSCRKTPRRWISDFLPGGVSGRARRRQDPRLRPLECRHRPVVLRRRASSDPPLHRICPPSEHGGCAPGATELRDRSSRGRAVGLPCSGVGALPRHPGSGAAGALVQFCPSSKLQRCACGAPPHQCRRSQRPSAQLCHLAAPDSGPSPHLTRGRRGRRSCATVDGGHGETRVHARVVHARCQVRHLTGREARRVVAPPTENSPESETIAGH